MPVGLKGSTIFRKIPFKALFEEMGRQYDQKIVVEAAIQRKDFRGTFDRNEPFLDELKRMCYTLGLEPVHRNGIYYIGEN